MPSRVAVIARPDLSGCASISQKFAETASQLPAVGLPAGSAGTAGAPAAYPAVHDIPPPRNSVVLTNFERSSLKRSGAARDQQQTSVGMPPKKKKSQPSPAKIVPVSAGPRSTRTRPKHGTRSASRLV